MPEVIQGQDPEENDKLVKNVVPDEPKNERPLDLDDWSNRCIYHEAPEIETDKLDLDDCDQKSSVTASEPRQCKDAKPAEDGKFAKDINKASCEVDEMRRIVFQFVFRRLNTLG
ncbi:hypothetical protein NC653_023444 [Populus alba x Populus x berolinensis]|uniref:Uncharacterized protein n=1 Tax=Populus alba x Populus x berolinensis TaxID=444605 RepID=A0AAD6MH87_9ROSI|nr:hypothetical protein NC653_023444 [Populus alba x Populus x berolinensis]